MATENIKLCEEVSICICTYKRHQLLRDLLLDLKMQTMLPKQVIIVDGDPREGHVKQMLPSLDFQWRTIYIPSNHANAPYQRYLGLKASNQSTLIVFIDDDIRIYQYDFLEKLIEPFFWKEKYVVGVSPQIIFPNRDKTQKKTTKIPITLQKIQNYLHQTQPGDITPVGDRVFPIDTDKPYADIKWLHGGVMAYRLKVLSGIEDLADAFAMSHIGCGLGVDDTYPSRWAMVHGKLMFALCAKAEHPSIDNSRITSENGFKKGYANAYSRRFINDHYIPGVSPTIKGRLYLYKSYIGNIVLEFIHFLRNPSKHQIQYLLGYSRGAIKGIFIKPTAKVLTPQIDWWGDSEMAIKEAVQILPC